MKKPVKILLCAIGGVAVIAIAASACNAGNTPPPSGPAATSSPASGLFPSPTTKAAPADTGPAPLATSFGNGTFDVGVEIKPGRYKSPGVQDSIVPLCSFQVTNTKTGAYGTGPGDLGATNEGPSAVTLKAGTTIVTHGCEDWTLVP